MGLGNEVTHRKISHDRNLLSTMKKTYSYWYFQQKKNGQKKTTWNNFHNFFLPNLLKAFIIGTIYIYSSFPLDNWGMKYNQITNSVQISGAKVREEKNRFSMLFFCKYVIFLHENGLCIMKAYLGPPLKIDCLEGVHILLWTKFDLEWFVYVWMSTK